MKSLLISVIICSLLIFPVLVSAQIVPNCPPEGCGWPELVKLSSNLVTFLIVLSIPLSAVAFAWAGFLYLTAAGNEEKIKKAHGIFWKVGIGLILVLSAWLIVWFITSTLLKDEFIILDD